MKFRALWLLLCIFLLTGCQTKEPADTDAGHLSPPSDAATDSSAGNPPQNGAGGLSSGQADNDIPLDEQKAEINPPPDGIEWQDPLVQFILTASLLPDEYQQFCEENLDLVGRANYTDGDFYARALAWEQYMAAHDLQVPEERFHQVFHFETWLHSSDSTVIELYLHDPEKGDIRVMPPGAAPTVQISPLDDLRHLPNLEVVRVAYNTFVRNIRTLKDLQHLTTLSIGTGYEFYADELENFPALRDLQVVGRWAPIEERQLIEIGKAVNLERLSLSGVNAADLSALAGLKNLKELSISSSNIADWSALAQLPRLESLSISASVHNLTELDVLAQLPGLTSLSLESNYISDLSPLSGLTGLKTLNLWQNCISDLSPLQSLTGLEVLDLSENRIRDVSPLAPLLRQLDELDVSYNEIEDLSPLGPFAQDGLSVAGNPGAES